MVQVFTAHTHSLEPLMRVDLPVDFNSHTIAGLAKGVKLHANIVTQSL